MYRCLMVWAVAVSLWDALAGRVGRMMRAAAFLFAEEEEEEGHGVDGACAHA